MAFTANDVKNLREMTGAGMMDCKKALVESDGDVEKAVVWLRERGIAQSQKKSLRIAAEGVAYADVIDGVGVVVEVNAETDFVAKNDKFIGFVKDIAATIAKNDVGDINALRECRLAGGDKTVAEILPEMIYTIGENITIRRFARYTEGVNVPYVHMGGKIGVMVNMRVTGISGTDTVTALGKDLAMQIASMRPLYLDTASVEASELEKEREIQLNKAIEENKAKNLPDDKARAVAEKMVQGRINKFYEDICLLNQPYVKDSKLTVERHVKDVAKELGGTITVKAFTRFEKGEGIEKQETDFACEVAEMVK